MRNHLAAIAAATITCSVCACGHAGTTVHPAGQATPTATARTTTSPTATSLAGCQQATLLAAAISSHLQQSPGDSGRAMRQLTALGKSLPPNTLKVDVDRAALDIALFRQYVLMGGPAAKAAKHFAADLQRIQADCA